MLKSKYFYTVLKHLLNSFVFIFLCAFQSYAQELIFTSLSDRVQLPSRECYKIVQDKKGYIWFSTDNGLCRYASGYLKTYNTRNGLPELSVYNMEIDPKGKLMFLTSKNRLMSEQNGVLKETVHNRYYNRFAVGKWQNPIPSFLDVSDSEHYFVGNYYYTTIVDPVSGSAKLTQQQSEDAHFTFFKNKGGKYIATNFNYLAKQGKGVIVLLRNGKAKKRLLIEGLASNIVIHGSTPTCRAGKTDFIAIQNKLLKIDNDLNHTVYDFPARILNIYTDHSNGIWVAVYKHGVYYYPDVASMQLGHNSLKEYSVTGICEDNENGIWCSTLENGIFYCRNSKLISYSGTPGLNKPVTLLKYMDGSLFVSAAPKTLFVGTNNIFSQLSVPLADQSLTDIEKANGKWYLSAGKIIECDQKFSSFCIPVQESGFGLGNGNFVQDRNRRVLCLQNHCIMEVGTVFREVICGLNFNVVTAIWLDDKKLLTGGKNGLYLFDVSTGSSLKIHTVPEKVVGLTTTKHNEVWIATKNNGLFVYANGKVRKIPVLNSIVFHGITADPDGNVWCASNLGLYKFDLSGENYVAELYSVSHGLPSSEVYKVAADREFIWFSTYEGLLCLPLNAHLLNSVDPRIWLRSSKSKVLKRYHLPYGQNELRLTFDVISFKDETGLKLEYRLKNSNGNQVTRIRGNEIVLENLDAGKHTLSVYGINNDGTKSATPVIITIVVDTPFWLNLWFVVVCIVVFVLIVFLIIRYIVVRISLKEEAKTRTNKLLAEYQITALQAQMNPHFIFNAINTIQGYIFEKNEDQAYDYLAKFSRLIRTVLHHSQEKILTLKDELEMLRLYIELEQMRFDFCFDYELEVAEDVDDSEIMIPGMILQPYVENAIWHGIVNLENSRRGKLRITLKKTEELLLITIQDNGIGRKLAKTFHKDRTHRSAGMQLTGERLDAMNKLYGEEMASVQIKDIYDHEERAAGTLVEISVPIKLES